MSTSISASDAMVLIVVPPWITPTFYRVFGFVGASIREMPAMARPMMWMALGEGKWFQLWPPRAVSVTL